MKTHKPTTDDEAIRMLGSDDKTEVAAALSRLYERFHPALSAFAAQRLFEPNPELISQVLSRFWEDLAEKGLADSPPAHEGGGAAARLFFALTRLLDRENKGHGNPDRARLTPKDLEALYSGRVTEEEKQLVRRRRETMGKALLLLTDIDPADARLVWMHLKGMDFPEIAEAMLAGRPGWEREKDDLARKLKERYFRPRTGARARFSALLARLAGPEAAN